jgi:ATP-dependent Clp protease ATP-binding subunit ClpB
MIRLDMSEYQERHTVSRLVGAPPGYIGYDEGGQLTEAVRRRPYCVVLFDEIEKAHPDVFNTLLQVLDDGRITDSQGRTVDFRNTIVIMTSNIGAEHLLTGSRDSGGDIPQDVKDLVLAELRSRFRPEFLNRVDDIIIFAPLGLEQIESIVDLLMADLARRLAERQIGLEVAPEARRLIAERGYDPLYGARPLRRYISHDIETRLGRALLSGTVLEGSTVRIDVRDGDIVVDAVQTPAQSDAEAEVPA